jgi:chromosomal replication initiation ATPase DnaA
MGTVSDMDTIMDTVCRTLNLSREIVMDTARFRNLVQARQLVMFFSRRYTQLSLTDIGRYLHKDHATVLHSVKAVECMMLYPNEKATIARIDMAISAALKRTRTQAKITDMINRMQCVPQL